ELPSWINYYQVLTAHGLFLVLVFSSFFTIGYFYAGLSHTLGGLLPAVRKIAWTGFSLKITGLMIALIPVLMNEASVLYTFYPPMNRKSTRLNSSHVSISYAVFCLKK